MKIFTTALGLTVAIVSAAPAAAQQRAPQARSQYGEADPIVLDAQRAYIFYRTPARVTYRFLREVTPTERAEQDTRRAAALVEARTKYDRRLRSWERTRRECGDSRSAYCQVERERPIEPTDANFEFELAESDNFVGNALRPRLMHDEAWSGWLIAVEPGTYSLYGALDEATGTGGCFCMGSVRFEARAGQITDMGEIQTLPADQRGDSEIATFRIGHFGTVTPPSPALRSPPQFANVTVMPAELRAADKMPNYFGVAITRLAPIPGILDYRRDLVIDGRTGRPLSEDAPAQASVR